MEILSLLRRTTRVGPPQDGARREGGDESTTSRLNYYSVLLEPGGACEATDLDLPIHLPEGNDGQAYRLPLCLSSRLGPVVMSCEFVIAGEIPGRFAVWRWLHLCRCAAEMQGGVCAPKSYFFQQGATWSLQA